MSREDLKFTNFPGQGREEVRYATDQSQVLLTALPMAPPRRNLLFLLHKSGLNFFISH